MAAQSYDSPLRRLDKTGVPLLIARLVLGALFIYMGLNKLGHPVNFLKLIHQYEMLPESPAVFLNSTAIMLPWLEIMAGVALILGIFIGGASLLIALMLAVFTPAVLIRALAIQAETGKSFFDIAFDCGCGGGVVIIWTKLLKNVGLFVLALIALFSRSRRFCAEWYFARRDPDSDFCDFCGYSTKSRQAGVCEDCAELPNLPIGEPVAP